VDLGSLRHDLVPDPATLRGRFPASWRSEHHRSARSARSTLQVRRYGVIRQGSGLVLRQGRIDLVHLLNQPCPGGLATGIGRHELVVAFQCGVRFGAIDNHAGVRCIAHLLERERVADHVAAEPLPALGIVGHGDDSAEEP
jgi:hypothetical protein